MEENISFSEYLKALKIVHAYHDQIDVYSRIAQSTRNSIRTTLSMLKKGDWVRNVHSESKYFTKGKEYQLVESFFHRHDGGWQGAVRNDAGRLHYIKDYGLFEVADKK